MALPAESLNFVLSLDDEGRTCYFNDYARYLEDAPERKYAIRVGSTTLYSHDTYDLRIRFDRLLKSHNKSSQKP